jgi:glutathione S-transferase
MKDGTLVPFRQLPILVVEGKTIAQTGAIARICGKLSGLYPEEMIEAGKVDQIIDTATDINVLLRPSMRESDPVKRKAMRVELAQNDLPKYFGYLENILTDNKSHWFVDDKMSIADIAIWRLMGWITSGAVDDIPKNILNPFKNLNKLYNEVKEDEKVSEWMLKTYKK